MSNFIDKILVAELYLNFMVVELEPGDLDCVPLPVLRSPPKRC